MAMREERKGVTGEEEIKKQRKRQREGWEEDGTDRQQASGAEEREGRG